MKKSPSGKHKKSVPSVREKTYEHLKSVILSGRFRPGERLAEEHLAEELGVSRTPVREALHKLEQDGLIEPLESRGFCIPHDSVGGGRGPVRPQDGPGRVYLEGHLRTDHR